MNNFWLENVQSPQLTQGLLGSTGNKLLAQRQNSTQQFAQQAMAQQQQQDAQNQGLLLSLAAKFLGGGF